MEDRAAFPGEARESGLWRKPLSLHLSSVLTEPHGANALCQSGARGGELRRWMITTQDVRVSVVPK